MPLGPWRSSKEPERPTKTMKGDAAENSEEPEISLKQLINRWVLWEDAFKKWTTKLKGKIVA